MNGALPPKSVLTCRAKSFMRDMKLSISSDQPQSFKTGERDHPLRAAPHERSVSAASSGDFAARCAVVQLARTADLVFRIGDHLVPLRDPAHGARERENRR